MKRFSRIILVFFLVNVLAFNFTFADTPAEVPDDAEVSVESDVQQTNTESETKTSNTPFELEGTTINTENIEEGITDIANKGESLAYRIVEQISDKSLPVCAILILWGAVLYFILGIRNLYKNNPKLTLGVKCFIQLQCFYKLNVNFRNLFMLFF